MRYYLVEIELDDEQKIFKVFEKVDDAETFFLKAYVHSEDGRPARMASGEKVYISSCRLHATEAPDVHEARSMVETGRAEKLKDSDDLSKHLDIEL